jgi:hypothetical protein
MRFIRGPIFFPGKIVIHMMDRLMKLMASKNKKIKLNYIGPLNIFLLVIDAPTLLNAMALNCTLYNVQLYSVQPTAVELLQA